MIVDKNKGTLHFSIKNKVATLEFGHPASNSFSSELLKKLTNALETLAKHPEVEIIVLKSQGSGSFCAGASFDELLAISNLQQGTAFFSGFANVINAMRKCHKLIIGRVHGKAVGGGVGLISACDYVFATKNAAVKLSELAIGIGPFVIEPAVSRKIGKPAMSEMMLAAHEWKNADWADKKGLYAAVFDTIEELDNALGLFCEKLASYSPEALLQTKKVLWENTDNWETLLYERAAISGQLVLSDVTKRALKELKKVK